MADKVLLYPKPARVYIGRSDSTERLYALEEKEHTAIEKCAQELMRLSAPTDGEFFWHRAVPHALKDILDSYTEKASIPAAIAYLESKGFACTHSGGDVEFEFEQL